MTQYGDAPPKVQLHCTDKCYASYRRWNHGDAQEETPHSSDLTPKKINALTPKQNQNSDDYQEGHRKQRANRKQTAEQPSKPIFIWKHVEHMWRDDG